MRVLLISLTAIASLVISFFLLFTYLALYEEGKLIPFTAQDEFYYQNFDEEYKKIFLLGRSYAGRINGTLINEQLTTNGYENYIFYNLAKIHENPIKVRNSLEKILYAKPDVVLYSVSIGELGYKFSIKNPENDPAKNIKIKNDNEEYMLIIDPLQVGEEYFELNLLNSFYHFPNPKLSTQSIIQRIVSGDFNATKLYPKYEDKPFYEGTVDVAEIITHTELKELSLKYEFDDKSETRFTKTKIKALKEIIDELHKNQIKVIIIVPPHSKPLLDIYPYETKQEFYSKLETLGIEKSVKIFNFLEEYSNHEIWSNLDHVSINPKSMIYSNDIAKIVIKEIKDDIL